MFGLMGIKFNVILLLNNKTLDRVDIYDNYNSNYFSIPNGKYEIIAKRKSTDEILDCINVELNDESIRLELERDKNNYTLKIEKKF